MIRFAATCAAFFTAIIPHAFAAGPLPDTPCAGLIGCGGGPQNVIIANLPQLGGLMITIASGCAVVFIAWAGFQMVVAAGNDGKISEQKTAILYVLGGLGVAILSQTVVTLVGTDPDLGSISAGNFPVSAMSAVVNIILTLFNGAFAIVIIIGGIRMVYSQGKSDEFNTGRKMIFWSIAGAIVTNVSNALVQALARMFGV